MYIIIAMNDIWITCTYNQKDSWEYKQKNNLKLQLFIILYFWKLNINFQYI